MARYVCSRSHLSPEQLFLLAAARSELDAETRSQIRRAIGQGVDGSALWELARRHGVGYFVGRHLLAHTPETRTKNQVPRTQSEGLGSWLEVGSWNSVRERVKEDLCREAARAAVLCDYQLRLNAELARANLPVLWLKGLVLAEQLYGRYEARQCGDLDILVDPSRAPGAERILAGLGFEPYHPSLPGQEYHPLAAHHTLWSLRLRDDWLLIVELHHRLSGPRACQPAVDHLLGRSRIVNFQGQGVRIPALEDELLILCLHAHHHNYSWLRCLMDVAEYLKRYCGQLDWPELVREARACYCLGRLRAALEITDAVLGLEPGWKVLLQAVPLSPRQRWACLRLGVKALLDPAMQSDDRRQARLALLMDRWRDVFRLFGRRLLPAQEHVRTICPAFLAAYPGLPRLYYFFHAFRRVGASMRVKRVSGNAVGTAGRPNPLASGSGSPGRNRRPLCRR